MADPNADMESKMSMLNVNASEFVPSWAPPVQNSVPTVSVNSGMQVDPPPTATADGGGKKTPVESWEDVADNSTASSAGGGSGGGAAAGATGGHSHASTPDDEDTSMETDDNGHFVPASKPKTKVKPKVQEATTTEKEHVNVVFIGHVDAGKSTIGGQIMKLTGMVDARTLEKYEREAKEKNRETWYLSWCMDTNEEEREKGKTVEVGRAYFETENKHFTILDAPGHKSFVPNMISGATQADLAVLVISARKGEFETGFERGGQTREHAMLVKTAGVKHLVILINKMDDPTVKWSEDRYNYCKENLTPYLKKVGFNPAKDIQFMPCSGLTGAGLLEPVGDLAKFYSGKPFIAHIDTLPSVTRNNDGPFMMPIVDKYADMGAVAMGKVESGKCCVGETLAIYPNKTEVKVDALWSDDIPVEKVRCGENIKVKLKGVDESDISPGFVLCDVQNPVKSCKVFDAQIVVLDYDSIISNGKQFALHLQAVVKEVELKTLICLVDKKTGDKHTKRPRFIQQDQAAIVRFSSRDVICMEAFKDHPQLGRFTLRDGGKSVGIGKVLKLVE